MAIIILVILIIGFIVWQAIRTRYFIAIGKALAAKAAPFSQQRDKPKFRILFVGDSSGVGTGASDPYHSLAGLTGKLYPQAEIVNICVNGSKAQDAKKQLETVIENFDLVMIHVGGNDTVHFTALEKLKKDIDAVLALAMNKGKNVLLTSTGNVGSARLLPVGSRWLFTYRTRQVRALLKEAVTSINKPNIRYTDLFRELNEDPFALEPKKYYAADMFHPSDNGYAAWFIIIQKELTHLSL